MQKCFKYKLYNSDKNIRIHRLINLSGEIYNHCIGLHKRYYRLYKKHLNKYTLQKHITKLKQRNKAHWSQLPSQSIQQITERIDNAYRRFYDYLKQKSKNQSSAFRVSPPSFRKRVKYKSFTLKQGACKLNDGVVTIGKYKYRYFNSRPIEGVIDTITVKRDLLGDVYICVTTTVKDNQTKSPMTGKSAGFDFGLKQFLTVSDGTLQISKLRMFRSYLASATNLKKYQRALSRKQKGSNNRKRARLSVTRLHKKVSNQREYHHHKLANLLISTYDELYFETLNIKAMQMMWGKKISDYGFADFMKILEAKAKENHKKIIYIDKWYPSSKTCNKCDYVYQELQLKDRGWNCPSCGTCHDRDKNAAKNIHRVGASTHSLGNVSPH